MNTSTHTLAAIENNMVWYFLHRLLGIGYATRHALVDSMGHVTTYQALANMASQAANGLKTRAIRPGDRVVIALPDDTRFAATLFGTLQIGAVAVMMDPLRPDEEILTLAREVGAKLVIVGHPRSPGCTVFSSLIWATSNYCEIQPVVLNDDAIWLFSGGTTGGRQKIVRQRHGSFIVVTKYLAIDCLGYSARDRTLSVPKLFFGYATGGNLLFPLAVGGTAVLCPEQPTPERIFAQIERHRPTRLFNTPAFIAKMLTWAEEHPRDRDVFGLKEMYSAGENLPEEIRQRWERMYSTVPLMDGLGFAEHWYFVWLNGVVIPPLQVKICGEAGEDVADGQVGYLWVSGPALANGYYKDEAATTAAFRNGGWFVPGDLARREADGQLTYIGRSASSFKVSGRWVYPAEIENCLLQHQAVAECAVVPYEAELGLIKPEAFIVVRSGASMSVSEIQKHVLDSLAPHKCPQQVMFLPELPRTPLGKVDLNALKKLLPKSI